MPPVKQNIQVITEFITKNARGFSNVMAQNMDQFKKTTTAAGRLDDRLVGMNNTGARFAHTTRILTHGMRGFRMELLGVMFFGMAISRVFTGMIRKSLEWAGTMDIMSAAMGILFLPLAESLTDWAVKFLD